MLNKFFVILSLILIFPFSVQAHTTLMSSTPAEGETVTEALDEVQLVFGTRIEEGSTMTIEGESGTLEFDGITVAEDSMTGEFSKPLANGNYRILWNIIGEDGHPIEGEIAFSISVEAEEEPATAPAAEEKAEEPAEQSVSASEEGAAPEVAEEGSNLLVTSVLVLIAALVIFGIYKLLMKKK
ncbi:methionine-rich copper-binding protein CopC [Planomicrobium stackebrandtii]|uniref:Methionine-rich copper-binding protein CopC n=1 Tax=Planomicrobium stackebrandtii TaxID=253160 RepID=A0ABU0GS81_9BACL|nr:copper resistance protein CopC [Planomicrobium stackebrandtii]MDQ0428219.1 methionine-rich copper-binding protein CopC [Planomicrobium stackebrandtii]